MHPEREGGKILRTKKLACGMLFPFFISIRKRRIPPCIKTPHSAPCLHPCCYFLLVADLNIG